MNLSIEIDGFAAMILSCNFLFSFWNCNYGLIPSGIGKAKYLLFAM